MTAPLLTAKQTREAEKLCVELPLMKDRCARAGLWQTMHAMEAAVKAIGWELAERAHWRGKKR